MALASRLSVPSEDQEEDPEDIFSSNINTLFTDTTVNSHGWPGASIIYTSPLFGDIVLKIPEQPEASNSKLLFAHYLWNAALVTAEAIQAASCTYKTRNNEDTTSGWESIDWDKRYWNVRGCSVLELGAGTALPSLIAALSGAKQVTITDHPSSPAITTNTIVDNVALNVMKRSKHSSPEVNVYGYLWGTTTFTDPPTTPQSAVSSSEEATPTPTPTAHQPPTHSFTKIIIADCLWMPSKHASIIRTILTYLSPSPPPSNPSSSTTTTPCVLLTAGFHTGRGIVSDFLVLATGHGAPSNETLHYDLVEDESSADREEVRGSLRTIELFEIDVDGERREWRAQRPGEGRDEAKRWCVCAVLVRRED